MSTNQIIEQRIDTLIDAAGNGPVSPARLRTMLDQIAKLAYNEGHNHALSNLVTADDLAERFGVSVRRIQAHAKLMHDRFGVGFRVPGARGQWLFTQDEIEIMRPGRRGRPAHE